MTVLNLSEVSKQFKVNRSTIYRAVSSGRLSRHADGSFDLAEVVRCFGEPRKEKVAVPQQQEVATSQQSSEELERLRREFSEYKRQAQEREDWFRSQIDRMQTQLEMKTHPVADATLQPHVQATPSDNADATSETIDNTGNATSETSHAMVQQYSDAAQRNTADATVQQPQKKRGLLSRLAHAVFE